MTRQPPIKTLLFLVLLLLSAPINAHAFKLYVTGGGAFERAPGAKLRGGLSVRSHWHFFGDHPGFGTGPLVNLDFSASDLTVPDLFAGWGIKYGEDFYFMTGAGAHYNRLFGLMPMLQIGIGLEVTRSISVFVPIAYKVGQFIYYMPFIGFKI